MAEDTGRHSTKSKKYPRPSIRKSVYLWEFLFGLLEDDECASVIRWTNKSEGIFTLKNADELAKLWGTVKNKPNMDKYKLFRAMRNYYNRGILKKVRGRNSSFQFLYIPYEKKGHSLPVATSCEPCEKPPFLGSVEQSLTNSNAIKSHCSERTDGHPETTADDWENTESNRENTESNRETTVNNCEQVGEERFDELHDYCSRATSSSGCSVSSNSSIKSLEELLADLMNTDVTGPVDVVPDVDNIV